MLRKKQSHMEMLREYGVTIFGHESIPTINKFKPNISLHGRLPKNFYLYNYQPNAKINKTGIDRLIKELRKLAPTGNKRMGSNPNANGGLLLEELKTPDFKKYGVKVEVGTVDIRVVLSGTFVINTGYSTSCLNSSFNVNASQKTKAMKMNNKN